MHTALVLFGLLALVLYLLLSVIQRRRDDAAFARQHNCQPCPSLPDGGFLGLGFVREMQAADKTKTFPDMLVDRQHRMDALVGRQCGTYVFTVLGKMNFSTSDPKNIQALLATKFDDFELGKLRREIMGPTLGDGIVRVTSLLAARTGAR